MIRLVIAEDQTLVAGALAALLETEQDLQVVAVAPDGRAGLAAVREHAPDLLLTDIEMPHMTGLELAQAVHREHPSTRVVIVTTFARPGYLRRALDAGAVGYLLKDSPAEQLAEALRRVHAGGRAISPELAEQAWVARDPLTDRERQILRLAGDGWSTRAIAGEIHLSEGTVRNYLSEAISKLQAENRIEAARIAHDKGWL